MNSLSSQKKRSRSETFPPSSSSRPAYDPTTAISSSPTHTPPQSSSTQSQWDENYLHSSSSASIPNKNTSTTFTKIQFVATSAMEFDPEVPTQHSLTPIPDAAQRFPIREDPRKVQLEEMTKHNRHLLQSLDALWNEKHRDRTTTTSMDESERRRRRRQSMYDASTSSDPAVRNWNHSRMNAADDHPDENPSKHHRTQRRQSMKNVLITVLDECPVKDFHPENHDMDDDDNDEDDDSSSNGSLEASQLDKSSLDTPRTLFQYQQDFDESYSNLQYDEDLPDLVEGSSSHSSQSNIDCMTESEEMEEDHVDKIVETWSSSSLEETQEPQEDRPNESLPKVGGGKVIVMMMMQL
jgi:hypothetical protein